MDTHGEEGLLELRRALLPLRRRRALRQVLLPVRNRRLRKDLLHHLPHLSARIFLRSEPKIPEVFVWITEASFAADCTGASCSSTFARRRLYMLLFSTADPAIAVFGTWTRLPSNLVRMCVVRKPILTTSPKMERDWTWTKSPTRKGRKSTHFLHILPKG